MPTSNLAIAPMVLHFVHEVPHTSVLDVGPGWGKYAVLIRETFNERPKRIDAVEMWEPYIEEHRLGVLYDEVLGGDVCDLEHFDEWDVVLMVDVIEHIDKERALLLLDRIGCRVVISTPVDWFSTGPNLPPTEAHVSHWTPDDFTDTGRVERMAENHIGGIIVRLGPKP